MADFQTLVGKALSDPEFCESLVLDPEATLKEHGIDPTPEMIEALEDLDSTSVQKLAAAFGKQQAA